jgi:hypothetical protein
LSFNRSFDLDRQELELVEEALQTKLKALSNRRLTHIQSTVKHESEIESVKHIDEEMKRINSLLGKFHGQKVWYRPKTTPYISG